MEWIERAVLKAILFSFETLTRDLGNAVMGVLSKLLVTPMGLLADLDLLSLISYTRYLAWLILPVVLIRQAVTLTISRSEGSASESVEAFVRRAAIAVAAVASTTAITGYMMHLADSIIQTFLQAETGITPLKMLIRIPDGSGFAVLILLLVLVIAFIVLIINRAILNAQLALNLAIGPLAACSLAWGDSSVWNTWLRETTSILLTFVMQTAMLWWLLRKLGSWGQDTFDSKLLILGIVVVMIKGGELVRKYTYAAGGGAAVLGGGAMAGRMAVTYAMFRSLPGSVFRTGGSAGASALGR